jgi:hypothetical protein
MNPELPGVNFYITTCLHGVDLRLTPRCYLCKPWPDDSPVWKVTSPGHVHEGEWCALCVEHGRALGVVKTLAKLFAEYARAPLDVERVGRIFHDRLDQSVLGHAGPVCQPCRQNAKAFAREYAALEEPTP